MKTCRPHPRSNPQRGIRWLWIVLALAACTGPPAPTTPALPAGQVVVASDLATDAVVAENRRVPILVVVTRHDCPYCMRIKQDILRPMLLSGDYEGRVTIRELMIDPEYRLRDFSGQEVTSSELAARYEAVFTPTVLLLDAAGNEVADRLLGINTTELYGYYLDEAINQALANVRSAAAG